MELVMEAFASNYIAPLGPMVDAFEREFAKISGLSHAVALSSGTAAIHLALNIIGVGPGDVVLASTLTFIGSVTPIIFQGAEPFFIDSDYTSWNMDPELLRDELARRAKRGKLPKAVVPTDIYGQCSDLDAILDACAPYCVPVVVDAAEAFGAKYKGRGAGVGARAAIFSFNGNKILTTSGGGMLASDDERLIEKARFLSQQARDPAPHYEHSQIGFNYRLSNVLAAIGRGQLRVLDDRISRKREIFSHYKDSLSDLPGIEFMPEPAWSRSTRWLTVVLITPETFGADPEAVRLALEAENIEARPVWKPMHLQPVFSSGAMAGKAGGEVAEDLFRRGLCLPSGTAMTDDDLDRIVTVIRSTAGRKP